LALVQWSPTECGGSVSNHESSIMSSVLTLVDHAS